MDTMVAYITYCMAGMFIHARPKALSDTVCNSELTASNFSISWPSLT